MNRRNLLKLSGQAAIGLMAVPFALKATESAPHRCRVIAGNAFAKPETPTATLIKSRDGEEYIIEIIRSDYEKNGRIRQMIQQDREWGL